MATAYATYLLKIGNINKGLEYIDLGIKLRPKYLVQWKSKVNAYYQITMKYLSAGDIHNALVYANRGLAVIEEARQENELSIVPFTADAVIMDNLEKLMYLKNKASNNSKSDKSIDVSRILFYNLPSMDINLDDVPDQWTTDNSSQIKLTSGENGMIVSGQKGFIQSRLLNFVAGKKYKIEVKLQNTNSIDKIPYSITNITGANEFLQYKNGVHFSIVKLPDNLSSPTGSLRLELPGGCVVEEVRMAEVG